MAVKMEVRTVDRRVQFNPDKYGWPWFQGTVSWVIPTSFSLTALRQTSPCCRTKKSEDRIRSGTEMLEDRACPGGGWNVGNGVVFWLSTDKTADGFFNRPNCRRWLRSFGIRHRNAVHCSDSDQGL